MCQGDLQVPEALPTLGTARKQTSLKTLHNEVRSASSSCGLLKVASATCDQSYIVDCSYVSKKIRCLGAFALHFTVLLVKAELGRSVKKTKLVKALMLTRVMSPKKHFCPDN